MRKKKGLINLHDEFVKHHICKISLAHKTQLYILYIILMSDYSSPISYLSFEKHAYTVKILFYAYIVVNPGRPIYIIYHRKNFYVTVFDCDNRQNCIRIKIYLKKNKKVLLTNI